MYQMTWYAQGHSLSNRKKLETTEMSIDRELFK